ncbi:excalibur calcium-binding domain-containing protein [Actinomycetota bacterium]|nr:excalibur calcium-binding domain-containing protein [Actinomycetota bacterium]
MPSSSGHSSEAHPPDLPSHITKYANCTEARAAGVKPIIQPMNPELYEVNSHMDRDGDGVACQ